MQVQLNKDYLIVRGYAKGIPFKDEEYYDKDGSTWLSQVYDLDPKSSMRIRLTINWEQYAPLQEVGGAAGPRFALQK